MSLSLEGVATCKFISLVGNAHSICTWAALISFIGLKKKRPMISQNNYLLSNIKHRVMYINFLYTHSLSVRSDFGSQESRFRACCK